MQAQDYSASPGELVLVDISQGSIVVTLPVSPPDGTQLGIKVVNVNPANTSGASGVPTAAHSCTILPGSAGTLETPFTLKLDSLEEALTLEFDQSRGSWLQVGQVEPRLQAGLAVSLATAVATMNQVTSGLPTVDGVALAAGQTLLLTAQVTASQNGPWIVTLGNWSRPEWWASGSTQHNGHIQVLQGATFASSGWSIAAMPLPDDQGLPNYVITVDTTEEYWVQVAEGVTDLITGTIRIVPLSTGWNNPRNPTNIGALNIEVPFNNLGVVVHQRQHSVSGFCGVNDSTGFRYSLEFYYNPETYEEEFVIGNNGSLAPAGSPGRSFADGSISSGSTHLLSPAQASFLRSDIGRVVTGPGLPSNTCILEYVSSSEVFVNNAATSTESQQTYTLSSSLLPGAVVINVQEADHFYVHQFGQVEIPIPINIQSSSTRIPINQPTFVVHALPGNAPIVWDSRGWANANLWTPIMPVTRGAGAVQILSDGSSAIGTVGPNPFHITADNSIVATWQVGGDLVLSKGSLGISTIGKGIAVAEGANAKQGTATLVQGTATVLNKSVTGNSRIFLTPQDNNTLGTVRVSARKVGSSFTITSTNNSDSGVVAYEIFEPLGA